MVDVRKPATLRGFNASVADVGDDMHLCHPLLSFADDPAMYLAHRLDWFDVPDSLAIADPEEAAALGTLLPKTWRRPITSGIGLVAAGAEFVQAAAAVKEGLLDSDDVTVERIDILSTSCWIGVATPEQYMALTNKLAEAARTAFDEAFRDAVQRGEHLPPPGNAALFLMRKCASLRREDFAIRQLAGERQNEELDIYRRLLMGFALELDTQEDDLDKQVRRHIAAVRQRMTPTVDIPFRLLSPLTLKESAYAGETFGDTFRTVATLKAIAKSNDRYGLQEARIPYPQLRATSEWKTMINPVSKHAEGQGERVWR